jgi:aromatic-L-amino-acid decarboxylase
VRAAFPAALPEEPEPLDTLLAALDHTVVPASSHWQHPGWFGYFPANASLHSLLGDMLSGGLGAQGMLWSTSPATTEVEQALMDAVAGALGLDQAFTFAGGGGGVIQDSASSAALVALLAALHRANPTWRDDGVDGRDRVYVTAETHSSLAKAARVAGLGGRALRVVDAVPGGVAMSPDALAGILSADVAAGLRPVLVCPTVGTTGTGAVDPVAELARIARAAGAWVHVDAAWAGVATVAPELRWLHDGVDLVDSYATNPHKWLLTNFDCDAFWVADRAALVGALSILPEYLRNTATESGAVLDYRDWHVPLGRRFRALKLWAVIRWYGADGLRAHIRDHVALAQQFASWVADDERFELVAPHPLSLVTFRLRAGDDATMALMHRVNASGDLYLTHTSVGGRAALRLAIGGTLTERRHVEAAWQALSR